MLLLLRLREDSRSMILKLKRTPGIYLAGFMGSGKSTVGRVLAESLGWRFVDLDEEIERREGMPVSEIFDTRGEAAFRDMESQALREQVRSIESGRPHVVALGGGAFVREENFAVISNNGVTVWLDCPFETVQRRLAGFTHRPLARDPEKLRTLFTERKRGYSHAEYRVHIEGDDPSATVKEIIAMLALG
jgi:shikimate kinase